MSEKTDELPYIVILDWDGTIAGRVDYQSHRYSLLQYCKKVGIKIKPDTRIPIAFNKDSNLIRKGLTKFIEDLKQHFNNNIYFFIYTASEKAWANKEIQWVEKTHNIKFERPIFTRDDCILHEGSGSYKKNISKIYPRILKSISKTPFSKVEKDYILRKHFIIIDNNAVYTDMQEYLLLCPDYGFMVFENIVKDIPIPNSHKNEYINLLINSGIICPFFAIKSDINQMMSEKYKWFASKCKEISVSNKKYANDNFFKNLKKLIIKNNIRIFSPNIIKQLQHSCELKN